MAPSGGERRIMSPAGGRTTERACGHSTETRVVDRAV